jgi:hypothetical protein
MSKLAVGGAPGWQLRVGLLGGLTLFLDVLRIIPRLVAWGTGTGGRVGMDIPTVLLDRRRDG